jgi:hypothetical protein
VCSEGSAEAKMALSRPFGEIASSRKFASL